MSTYLYIQLHNYFTIYVMISMRVTPGVFSTSLVKNSSDFDFYLLKHILPSFQKYFLSLYRTLNPVLTQSRFLRGLVHLYSNSIFHPSFSATGFHHSYTSCQMVDWTAPRFPWHHGISPFPCQNQDTVDLSRRVLLKYPCLQG